MVQRLPKTAAALLLSVVALVGCGLNEPREALIPEATPTIAPFFRDGAVLPVPTVNVQFAPTPTPIPVPTPLPPGSVLASRDTRPDRLAERIREVPVYDGAFHPDWTVSQSWDMQFNPASRNAGFADRITFEGRGKAAFGGVLFGVKPSHQGLYERKQVLGIRFRISGGAEYLSRDSLIIKILGSNTYSYWVEGDTSVQFKEEVPPNTLIFDEIGLRGLGLKRDIPPGVWAELDLWLDDYDRVDYKYITGIVIMNEPDFRAPFFIDAVHLLVER
ncbi:MAG: hypothetical protein MUD01_00160 [Chloroflexaceae bacterium]|jgi:hypothetical protein|nr:hypothetical protein [Chloroflexaceae bacterium]